MKIDRRHKLLMVLMVCSALPLAPSDSYAFEKAVSCAGSVFQKALSDLGMSESVQVPAHDLGCQAIENRGTNSLYQIKKAAQTAGLHVQAFRIDLENLYLLEGKGVFIANMTGNHHFCLIRNVDSENVTMYIPDVRHPLVKMPISFAKLEWDNVVLLVSKERVSLRPYRGTLRPASDRHLKAIYGGADCCNTSGSSPGGIPVGNGSGSGTGGTPSSSVPPDAVTQEPVVIRNGNLFLNLPDISVPTRGLPLSLERHYNAQVVSEVAGWQAEQGAGSWVIEGGEYSGQGDRSATAQTFRDFTLELDMKTIQPGANYSWETGWVNFRYVPSAVDPRKVQDGYYFLMHTDGRIEFAKWKSGTQYFLYNKPTVYRPVNKNRIKIQAAGANIKIYVNGNLEMDFTDNSNPVLAAGKIALESFFSHAHFDNVQITSGAQVLNYDFNTDDNEFIFGYGWTHSYFMKLKEYGDHVTLIRENGEKEFYKPTTGGAYEGVVPTYDKLTKDAQGYSLKTKYGTHYRFNLTGQLLYVEDRNLNRTTLDYALVNGKSSLASVAEPAGRKLLFTYGANGSVSKVTDPQGNFFQYFYDSAGHLIRVLDPNLNQTLYAYDAVTHNLTQLTDPDGYVFKYAYSYNDRVTTQTDPKGAVTTFDYLWSTVHIINGRGQIYMYNFDANLHLQSVADPLNKIERTVNDAAGNALEAYDRNNNKSVFTYDALGNRTSMADPLGNTTAVTYDPAFSQPKTVTDAKGSVTTLTYDAKGNLLQSTDALGGTLKMTYNTYGQPLTVTDALGKVTTFTYDTYGNVATRKDPLGNITTFTYDILGRVTRVTDPLLGVTDTTYDKNGNVLTVKDPLGNVMTFTYTKKDRVATVKDPLLNVTTFTYDCFGNRTSAVDAMGKTALFTYDTVNQMHINQANLIQLKDASGNLTNYTYDALDRPTQTTDALGNVHKFFYDNQGNLISRTDAKLQTVNYQYDALNRLKKTIYPDAKSFELTYDAVGNVASVQDWNGTLQFAYDKLNRVTAKTYPDLVRLDSTYDPAGNRTSLTIPGYGKILYAYDAANRLVTTTTPDARVATFTYDKLSRRTKLVYPNGSSAAYTYDAASRLQQVLNTDKNAVNASKAFYVYDAASRRTRVDYLNGSVTYTYDKLSQLLKEQGTLAGLAHSVTYTYDPLGNRLTTLDGSTTTTYTNNALNQATKTVNSLGTFVYTYDANGNLVKRESPGATDSSKGYTYDFENRLIHHAGGFSVGGTADYAYNGLGERVSKTIMGQTKTTYYYDGADLVLEKNGTASTAYVAGPRIDEILTDSRKFSYQADGQGSVLNLTDPLGVKSNTYSYTAFGSTKAQTGAVINTWLYTGRQYDSESGLYFNRNRYYSPFLGKFITKDPIGIRGGVNLYAYTQNNPTNWRDPLGLKKYQVVIETAIREPHVQSGVKSTQTISIDTGSKTSSSIYSTGHTSWCGGVQTPSRSDDFNVSQPSGSNGVYNVSADGTTGSWGFPANIDYNINISINENTNHVTISGNHDGFPSYNVALDGKTMYDYTQGNIIDLFGHGDDVEFSTAK